MDFKNNKDAYYQLSVEVKPFYTILSRLFDVIMSFVALIVSSPLVLIAAIAIKLDDGGAVFYTQNRVGKDKKEFTIYKMRSMKEEDDEAEFVETDVNDCRITRVGKFIRKTRIDEIPQLLNILFGDMKLIGPRPLVPEQIEEFSENLPEFVNRLVVKPGLTGLAQVSGGNDLTPEEKLILDVEYIEHRGFLLDLKIIGKTIMVVLSGDGAR